MNEYVKFRTNIAEPVTFKYDQPKEYPNKFKPGEMQYSYGVEWHGVDAYLTATPKLNELLQGLPKREGEQIQILKYEEGTTKFWKIMDAQGNDITPGQSNVPKKTETRSQGQIGGNYVTLEQYNQVLEKQRAAFAKMSENVDECVEQVEYFKQLWKTQNPEANKVHEDAIPIIGENDWASETSEKLFDK